MRKAQLEALELEIKTELYAMAKAAAHDPITDGVIDIDQYLAASPKMLWILKEPWETPDEGKRGGRWSVTKELIPELIAQNRIRGNPTYRKMAYVTYSVFHDFVDYSKIKFPDEDPEVRMSLEKIAYINVSKSPGKSVSDSANIEFHYRRNRELLKKQIAAINPDIVIAGNILHLFYDDFGFSRQDLTSAGSAEFCERNGCLYVNAYHPAYWGCKEDRYVNDLVTVIKNHQS